MSKRISLNVSLTTQLAAFVIENVPSGQYGSAGEIVHTGLRLLQKQEAQAPAHSVLSGQAVALP